MLQTNTDMDKKKNKHAPGCTKRELPAAQSYVGVYGQKRVAG